ncbi:DUF3043 domain-containing protein [Nonomuraea salmonea]|uniref:DUF3043 domain-containing protein n=1 Tax=Nonomuraea salmonea TaxID=46181 RepID=UPI0031E5ABFA
MTSCCDAVPKPPWTTPPVPDDDPKPQGKGRPTPKRRDAEGRRRQYVSAPKDRKEAYRQMRAKQATEREKGPSGHARR